MPQAQSGVLKDSLVDGDEDFLHHIAVVLPCTSNVAVANQVNMRQLCALDIEIHQEEALDSRESFRGPSSCIDRMPFSLLVSLRVSVMEPEVDRASRPV